MFCKNCGKELAEGAAFCAECGQPVTQEAPAAETPVAEIPVEMPAEEAASAVPAEDVTAVAQADDGAALQEAASPAETPAPVVEEAPAVPVSKKRRFPFKWAIAAAVAVAAVVALVLNMGTIVGSVIKTFGSDTDYYKYVELKTVKNGTDTVTDYYGLFKDTFTDSNQKVEGSFRPVLGDDAQELLELLPVDMELDWLNDLKLSYTSNIKDDTMMFELAVAVADGDPLKAIAIMNKADGKLYAGLPSVDDTYLELDMNVATDTAEDVMDSDMGIVAPTVSNNSVLDTFLGDTELTDKLSELLPSDKEMDKLLDRYLSLVLDMVEVESAESVILKIDGVEQSCTESTITVTQKLCADIMIAVVTEAKTDKDIKAIIDDAQKFLNEQKLDEEIDLYTEYGKAMDEALAVLADLKATASDEVFAEMKTYISKQHEIIGRRVEVSGREVFYYATAKKGSAFASEMIVANAVKLSGKGTEKGDVVSGDFELEVNGEAIIELTVKDFDKSKAEEGYLNGSFRIAPKKALLEMMGAGKEATLLLSTYDPSLEFVAKNSKNATELAINLYKDESLLVGLVFESKTSKADKVTIPENTLNVTDEDSVMEWFNQIEGDTVSEKLETIGVPDEIMDILNVFLAG